MFMRWKINRLKKKIKAQQANRVHNQPTDEVLKKEISNYFALVACLKKVNGHKKYPYSQILLKECYRAAADLLDVKAHYLLGKLSLEEANYRQGLDAEGIFNSQENLNLSRVLYQEAHVHLGAAENLGHIAAKRLKGLCYINAWGVEADKARGLELIVESIEEEGSWDKVPQIFAEIGLNKPEFFTAILQRRKIT